jgi:hypothetical protein
MTNVLDAIKLLWAAVMPNVVQPVDEYAVYTWVTTHPLADVKFAIQRSGEKMKKNVRMGLTIPSDAAQRYTSSILRSRAEWRRNSAMRKEAHSQTAEELSVLSSEVKRSNYPQSEGKEVGCSA